MFDADDDNGIKIITLLVIPFHIINHGSILYLILYKYCRIINNMMHYHCLLLVLTIKKVLLLLTMFVCSSSTDIDKAPSVVTMKITSHELYAAAHSVAVTTKTTTTLHELASTTTKETPSAVNNENNIT